MSNVNYFTLEKIAFSVYNKNGNVIQIKNRGAKNMKLSIIFEETPEIWGFRGDPYFWKYLKEIAENMDIISPDELEKWIKNEYFKLSGKEMTFGEDGVAVIEQFAHGGMSSGGVDSAWWLEDGIPLLKSRLESL